METVPKIRTIAFLGDYLPRKCGIATFTTDLLAAVTAEYPASQCFAVPVNDIEGGYEYADCLNAHIPLATVCPQMGKNTAATAVPMRKASRN